MGDLLKTTFIIIIGFSLLNLGLSLWFLIRTRLKIHGLQAGFWLSLVLNFFIQGSAVQASVGQILLCYAFSLVPVNLLSMTSFEIAGVRYPAKIYIIVTSVLCFINFFLVDLSIPFTWKAMPIAIAVAIPVFHASGVMFKKGGLTNSPFHRIMALVLFAQGVHSINFALFRMEPDAQLWGWITAYALYQLIAVFLPVLSLDFHNRTEKNRLRRMVEEKTDHLQQANKELDSLNRQNSLLLKVLLHDISNSLVVASFQVKKIGNILMALDDDSGNNGKIMSKLEGRMEVLADLISQVRDYESVRSGKSELSKEWIGAEELKEEIHARFEDQLKEKSLNLAVVCDKDAGVYADRTSFFNSILSNLVSNAIKFSPKGSEISIEIDTQSDAQKLKVTNAGEPIPNQLIPKLFSFEHKTTKVGTSGEKGTGFGLPILREFMNLHQGQVEVVSNSVEDSRKGVTSFILLFPSSNSYA